MFRKIQAGKTGNVLPIRVYDSSSASGAYLGSIAHNTAGLVGRYRRQGNASWTTITIVTATAGIFTSGGWVAPGSGPSGSYEIHVPDAAFAAGAEWVEIEYGGVANMLPVQIFVELDAVDYQTNAFGALRPTTAGRTLDVSAGGEAGIDWANVGSPSTTLNLSGTTVAGATTVDAVSGPVVATDEFGGALATASALTDVDDRVQIISNVVSSGTFGNEAIKNAVNLAATASSLTTVGTNVSTLLTRLTSARAGYLDTLLKMDGMLVLDGALYQFTANALELAPGGGSTGSGTYALTVTVRDEDLVAVPGVIVTVLQSGTQVAWGTTAPNGQVVFNLNAATYQLTISASSSYQPESPATVSVSGNTSSVITLTAQSITPPASPGVCTVRFTVVDADGDSVEDARVVVWLEDDNSLIEGAMVSREKVVGTTNADGYVDLDMIQFTEFELGGTYIVQVSDNRGRRLHERRVRVPTLATCTADQLTGI